MSTGVDIEHNLEQWGEYISRRLNPRAYAEFEGDDEAIRSIQAFMKMAFARPRKDEFTDIPGVTFGLSEMTMDPKVVGTQAVRQQPDIYKLIKSIDEDPVNGVIHDLTRSAAYLIRRYQVRADKARAVATQLSRMPRKLADNKIPLFDPDYVGNAMEYLNHSQELTNTILADRHLLAEGLNMANKIGPESLFAKEQKPFAYIHDKLHEWREASKQLTGTDIASRLGVAAVDQSDVRTDLQNLFMSKHTANLSLRDTMKTKAAKYVVDTTAHTVSEKPLELQTSLTDWILHPVESFKKSQKIQAFIRGAVRGMPDPTIPLEEVWKEAGWKSTMMDEFILSVNQRVFPGEPAAIGAQNITRKSPVPRDIANMVINSSKAAMSPQLQDDFAKGVLKMWDKFRALTGIHLTSPLPFFGAFHTRNLFGGQWSNLITLGLKAYIEGMRKTMVMLFGKGEESRKLWSEMSAGNMLDPNTTPGSFFGKVFSHEGTPLSPHQFVTAPLASVFAKADVLPGPMQRFVDRGAVEVGELAKSKELQAGLQAAGIKGKPYLTAWMRTMFDFFAVRGVRERGQPSVWLPQVFGEVAYNATELMNRSVQFFGQKYGHNLTEEAAARMVNRVHYNYSNMGQYEKSVLRRIIPFYGWLRNNIPYLVTAIAENPAGGYGQTIRALNATQRQDKEGGWVPSWLKEAWAIPLGATAEGGRLFLSGNPFPLSDLNNFQFPAELNVNDTYQAIKNTLDRTASNLHPMIKWLLETMAGRELHTGRALEEVPGKFLAQLTGSKAMERFALATPASRYINLAQYTLNQPNISVPQKIFNWAMAMRFRELSPEDVPLHQRSDLQKWLEQQAYQSPYLRMLKSPYALEEDFPNLTTGQLHGLAAFRSLQRDAQRLSRKLEKEKKGARIVLRGAA
jgi:hypothetical protein